MRAMQSVVRVGIVVEYDVVPRVAGMATLALAAEVTLVLVVLLMA